MTDTGTFRTDVEIENPQRPGERRRLEQALVDTGAELSWFPRSVLEQLGVEQRKVWHFRQADGSVLSRWTGAVNLYVAGTWTVDEVVFGEPGDLLLLGARSLEGLNLRVEPVSKRLVDAGPAPAAALLPVVDHHLTVAAVATRRAILSAAISTMPATAAAAAPTARRPSGGSRQAIMPRMNAEPIRGATPRVKTAGAAGTCFWTRGADKATDRAARARPAGTAGAGNQNS
jgi:predicted aspartyl protease